MKHSLRKMWRRLTDGVSLFRGHVWLFIEPRDAFIGVSVWGDCVYIALIPCFIILIKHTGGDRWLGTR